MTIRCAGTACPLAVDILAPWNDYRRDRLPPEWTYPLGRKEFRQALTSRQARLGRLSLVRFPSKEPEPVYLPVVDWFSDARTVRYETLQTSAVTT